MFLIKLDKCIHKHKSFKFMESSLVDYGQKNIKIMWKGQKVFKKVFITLQIINLWYLILK